MKTLARRIERQLQIGEWKHCAVYEDELKRLWPLDQKERPIRQGIRIPSPILSEGVVRDLRQVAAANPKSVILN